MKLRVKTIIFFSLFLLTIVLAILFFTEYVVGRALRNQTTNDLRIFAEQSEGAYYTFLRNMKGRAIDWSSNSGMQRIAKELISSKPGSPERERSAKEFADYVTLKKMPYDKSVFLADILDVNGVVIASTNPNRIGVNELEEEKLHNVSHFSKTITSKLGEAFVKSIVFEDDETTEPMVHATVRIFVPNDKGEFVPLDAVLMLHFVNIQEIAKVISGESQLEEGALTGRALHASYRTSEIYIVNSERVLMTPTRNNPELKSKRTVNTYPVSACLDHNKETVEEYDDYRGVRVLGASMCLQSEGLVLIVEIAKDEIFEPLNSLVKTTAGGAGILFILGLIVVSLFVRIPLSQIEEVIYALKRVIDGDFKTRMVVRSKDEIGRLAAMFNTMTQAIETGQDEIEKSKHLIEEKALLLQKDVEEHKKQEKFLDQSKKATLNLLEDSWKAKEKLEDEGRRLQTILASIGDGLFIVDGAYRITLANTAIAKMFGMDIADILGKDLRTLITLWKKKIEIVPPPLWPIEEVFLTKKTIEATIADDFSMSTEKQPEKVPIAFSIAHLGKETTGAVIVVRDVTKDRELDDAKSGFISVASHQLRTPLTSIRWYSEMLLSEDAGPLNESQKDFMKEVHGGAERLYQTVDLLLGISRVESGKIKTEKTSIDLGVFTSEIEKEMKSQIDEKELTITTVRPEGDPIVVMLDSLTLRQVILNLFSNAIRYTNNKGIIEVKWWTKNEEIKEVIYMVHDDGIGIPESQRPRIFSKFFRAENARAQVPDGSGLGLALVKELVEAWGGKVWFETTEGQGTTFFFTIPLSTEVNSGSK